MDPDPAIFVTNLQDAKKIYSNIFLKLKAVLRIHDILVWIRIRGSMPLTNGYESGSFFFVIDLHTPTKNLFILFSAYYGTF
jgi:hypothetical protein